MCQITVTYVVISVYFLNVVQQRIDLYRRVRCRLPTTSDVSLGNIILYYLSARSFKISAVTIVVDSERILLSESEWGLGTWVREFSSYCLTNLPYGEGEPGGFPKIYPL